MRAEYDSIYFDLKQKIEDNTYPYESFLPSEAQLIKRYGCAHNTVRKAISELATCGYVQPIHGVGVRVIYQGLRQSLAALPHYESNMLGSFATIAENAGLETTTKLVLMEKITADAHTAKRTHFDEESDLTHLVLVYSYDGKPMAYESSYFRSAYVEGMTTEDAEASHLSYLQNTTGRELALSKRRVYMDHVCSEDADLLALGDANYLAVLDATTFDSYGIQCAFTTIRHHPTVFSLLQPAKHSRIR